MRNTEMRTLGDYEYNQSYCVGEGSFGKVFKGNKFLQGILLPLKRLMHTRQINNNIYGMLQVQCLLYYILVAEINLLNSFSHPNIVKFIAKFNTTHSIYIVTEFCQNGDLKSLMKNTLCEQEAFQIFCQIIEGMKALVGKNIVHRDLKPANILNHNGIMKIADFGFAKYIDNYNDEVIKTYVGTPLYMSPQILKGQKYTTKSDIWSLGVIYYEMLYNKPPFNGQNEDELRRNINDKDLIFPKHPEITQESQAFLKGALQKEENDRNSWDYVFKLFGEIKEKVNHKLNTLIVPQQLAESTIIVKSVVNSFEQQMKLNKRIRQQLSFTYFVNVEMIQNCNLFKNFCQDFNKVCLFLAKMVDLKYHEYFEETYKLLNSRGEQLDIYSNFLEIINEESTLASNLMEDILNEFSQQEQINKQISEYNLEQLGKIVNIRIVGLIKSILVDYGNSFEVLSLLNYMIEALITKKQLLNNQDIDYRAIHEIQQFKNNLKYFVQVIQSKVNKFDDE